MSKILELEDGKYKIQQSDSNAVVTAFRYGEYWRDLTGDKLILALLHKIEQLEEQRVQIQLFNHVDKDFLSGLCVDEGCPQHGTDHVCEQGVVYMYNRVFGDKEQGWQVCDAAYAQFIYQNPERFGKTKVKVLKVVGSL